MADWLKMALEDWVKLARRSSDDGVREMQRWATERDARADRPGAGRNPKARRRFRQMRDAAQVELDRRGQLWPSP